ncbi:hypothetical protein [Mucilaginibacter sp.]
MEAKEQLIEALNPQQIMMLRLLKNPLPEPDFIQIRKLAVQLLAKQLDDNLADWEEQNGITSATYEELSKHHFRSSENNT